MIIEYNVRKRSNIKEGDILDFNFADTNKKGITYFVNAKLENQFWWKTNIEQQINGNFNRNVDQYFKASDIYDLTAQIKRFIMEYF